MLKQILLFSQLFLVMAALAGEKQTPSMKKLKAAELDNDMLAAADPVKGKELAVICTACHAVNRNEQTTIQKNSKGNTGQLVHVGPPLYGIYETPIAVQKGYLYSAALKKHKGKTWTVDELDKWLKSPTSYAPGTLMTFAGLLDPQDRYDVIAYIISLK